MVNRSLFITVKLTVFEKIVKNFSQFLIKCDKT